MSFGSLRTWWDHLSFQPRLTIGLTTLFALILALGYWSLFLEFQDELKSDFDHSLHNYARDLIRNLEILPSGKADLPHDVIFSADKVFPFPHGDSLVKIYHLPKQELFSFSQDQDAPRDLAEVHRSLKTIKQEQFFDLQAVSGEPWRGVVIPLNHDLSSDLFFFVAVPRKILTSLENKFRSIFVAGQIIILVLSAFMISVLAKSLLKSLVQLTESIRDTRFSDKAFVFEVPKGPPEITLLAEILNKLIAQIGLSLSAHQEFVAKAAHQLKTPLTIAKGHLEQLEKSALHPSKDLKVALDEIDIMSGTINHLLTLVQLESGFQTLSLSPVNVLEQLLNEIDRLDYLAQKRGLKFQVKCNLAESHDGLIWITDTDPQLLTLLLHNILENAIKYALESPIEAHLAYTDGFIIIEISNKMTESPTKIPISEFKEKYVRGNQSETGQGLGLYIAYKVASFLKIELNLSDDNHRFKAKIKMTSASQITTADNLLS